MGEDNPFGMDRRSMMQATGIGGLSLAGIPGVSSAESRGAEAFRVDSLTLSNGLIDNSQRYEIDTDVGSDVTSQIQSQGGRIVTDVDFQKGIAALNDAKRKGHVELTEEDGVVQVGLTEAGRRAAEEVISQIGASGHGVNKYETNPFSIPPNIRAWTDDPTTESIIIGTATVAALLGIWGVTGNVPAAIASIILGLAATIISTVNDGHGVIFTFNVAPVLPLPSVIPTITAQ